MVTYSDFVTATPGTAGTEAAASTTISVPAGARLKRITIANPTVIGMIYSIRLDYTGIKTPQKFTTSSYYEPTGTEIEYTNAWPEEYIDIDIPIEKPTAITIYVTADVNSTVAVIGLIWEA